MFYISYVILFILRTDNHMQGYIIFVLKLERCIQDVLYLKFDHKS